MASYYPMVKNSAQRIVFPILDADGDPVTGAAGDTPDSEYSLDGASFIDCSDEIHEIATSSGVYYLDLLAGETNGDVVCIQVKTATATTKTTVLVFYTSAQSLDTVDGVCDSILTESQSHPTLAEIEGSSVLAMEASLTAIKGSGFDTGTDSLVKLHDDHVTHITAAPSTHAAADVWSAAGRELSTPANYKADVSNLDQAISTTESNIRGGSETLDTIKSAVSGIQNNTRFTAAVPKYMCKPDAGDEAFKWSANLYDTNGNMEDPDDSEIIVRVTQDNGTYLYNLYKEVALTNLLDNATDTTTWPPASGWRALERTDVGRYFAFYKCANDATEETLTVEFGWEEGGTEGYQTRSTEVADVHGDLTALLSDTNAIKTATDKLTFNAANMLQSDVREVNDGAVAGVNDFKADVSSLALEATLTDIKGSGFATATDSLVKIHDDHVTYLSAAPSTHSAADVWTTGSRELSTPANYKADVSNLDVAVSTRSSHTAANVWAVGTRTLTDKAGFTLSAAGIDSIVDEVIEGTITLRQAIRLTLSMLAGKSSGGGTTSLVYRDYGDSKDRLTFTVDANGNRTAVTRDVS